MGPRALGPELEELHALDFDLELTGFDPAEIEDFLADPDVLDRAEIAPPVPAQPVSKPGDFGFVASTESCAEMRLRPLMSGSCAARQRHSC